MLSTVFGLALVTIASADIIVEPIIYNTSEASLLKLFGSFQEDYSRTYESVEEEAKRYLLFIDNVYKINDHNKHYPNIKYTVDINQFADWTKEEFHKLNNAKVNNHRRHQINFVSKLSALPTSIDWSTVTPSVVTPVKNQGNCGSCWAFGATGSWESRYAIKYGVLNSLSEQELVDCDPANNCILGGNSDDAFFYGMNHGGLSLESDYAYTAKDGTCQQKQYKHYDPLTSIIFVREFNETAMMEALVSGPITVSVNAAWGSYKSGIFDGHCPGDWANLDHDVCIVGYGQDSNGNKYWKVKNSWGKSWGMDGYILICRDCDKNGNKGECGINFTPSYPLIASNNTKIVNI
eukprot:198407_1